MLRARRLRAVIPLVAAVASLALLAGCGDDAASSLPDGVVARVGDATITQEQLDRAVATSKAEVEAQGGSFPAAGSAQYDQVRQQALENLRLEKIVQFEARKCGKPCAVEPSDVDAELQRIVKTNFNDSRAQLTAFLKRTDRTEADARQLVRSQLEQQALFDHVTRSVRFSDAEAQKYYDTHPAEFRTPAGRTARHILVGSQAEAQRIRAQATGQNFAALAKQYSTDQGTKAQGGQLGPVQKGAFVPEFEKAALALKDGQISQPVKTQFGWHLILVDITPARVTPFAEARSGIITTQLEQKRQAEWTEWRDGVIADWDERTTYADDSLKPATEATTAGGDVTVPEGAPAPQTSTTP